MLSNVKKTWFNSRKKVISKLNIQNISCNFIQIKILIVVLSFTQLIRIISFLMSFAKLM